MICQPCKEGEHAYCEYPPLESEIQAAVDEMLCTGFHREYRGKGCTCEHRLARGVVETGNSKQLPAVTKLLNAVGIEGTATLKPTTPYSDEFRREVEAGVEPATGPAGE